MLELSHFETIPESLSIFSQSAQQYHRQYQYQFYNISFHTHTNIINVNVFFPAHLHKGRTDFDATCNCRSYCNNIRLLSIRVPRGAAGGC